MKTIKQLLITALTLLSMTITAKTVIENPKHLKEVIGSGGFKILNVNDIRNYTINSSTILSIDGIIQNITTFEVIGSGGYKIRFKVAEDVNTTISQGTLEELHLISDIKGPITNLDPLEIMNQGSFITSDTILVNINNINSLQMGDDVSASGAIDAVTNSLQLSRLEKHSSNLSEWKIRGFVKNITANTFMIGGLTININAIMPSNCNNGFINNVFVSVKATPDAGFTGNNALTTLTSVECESPDVNQAMNNSIPSVVEGIVSDVINFDSFKINDLIILVDANTEFDNGELEHIDVGSKVEVQGLLNTTTREINASTVRFIHHRIKILAPASPIDITNNSLQLFNKIILTTPLTQDDDLLLINGISTDRQIEVRGFIDSAGQMYALRVRNRDTADAQNVKLRGDVTAINKPFLSINDILIDASFSEFQQLSGLVNNDIDIFFNDLSTGMQASIKEATYDPISHIISLGLLEISEQEIEDDPNSITTKSLGSITTKEVIGSGGVGLATITVPTLIFKSDFE